MAKALEKLLLSSFLEKKIWATLEDGIHHLSFLNDYRPELLSQKNRKNLNRMLLHKFKPTLFKEKLKSFLLNILSN
jgi:heptosyltransferase-2